MEKTKQQNSSQEGTAKSDSQSSFDKLHRVILLERAVATIERDIPCSPNEKGHLLGSVLHRRLSSRLSESGLTPESIPERLSVIVRTPPRTPITSTPHSSPSKSIPPPRSCQSIGPIVLDTPPRAHSPCSELSSIDGEVFPEDDDAEVTTSPIERPTPTEESILRKRKMDEQERKIRRKKRECIVYV